MRYMPWHLLNTRWISADRLPEEWRKVAEDELDRAIKSPGWNVKHVKIGKGKLIIIDVCANPGGGLHSVRVALAQDHPVLRDIQNAPKPVKSLYSLSVRLAHTIATSGWDVFKAIDRIDSYLANRA